MGKKQDRDVERVYSTSEFVSKLRRLADALETGERFAIQVAGERVNVPARAEFNESATVGRLMATIMSALIAIIVNMFVLLITIAIIGAQLVLAQMLAITPLSVMSGIVPGVGRELLAKWLGIVLQSLAAIVVLSFVLTLYIEMSTAILGAEHGGYVMRFFVLMIAVIMLIRGRKKLLSIAENDSDINRVYHLNFQLFPTSINADEIKPSQGQEQDDNT